MPSYLMPCARLSSVAMCSTGAICSSKVAVTSLRARARLPSARGSASASSADVSQPTANEAGPSWYAAGKKGMPGGTLKEAQNWKLPSPPSVTCPIRMIARASLEAPSTSSGSASTPDALMRGPNAMMSGTSAMATAVDAGPTLNKSTPLRTSSASMARIVQSVASLSETSHHSSNALVERRVVCTSNPADLYCAEALAMKLAPLAIAAAR
mmetsp:Transcript_33574/g.88372  ORF Transcript_33574/g.88372 Transcript_33574/m.88372 type:complete len:211 (-) Transcript_33574:84-716(-)